MARRNLLLSQASGLAYLGETVPDDGCQEFLLACLDRLLTPVRST
jgi:hypothetical protein